MLPMRDMFYGKTEPVWILNHDKDDNTDEEENDSRSDNEAANYSYSRPPGRDYYPYHSDRNHFAGENDTENQGRLPPTGSIYYQYHPGGHYVPVPVDNSRYTEKEAGKETEVVMKVPICCGGCEDSVRVALYGLEGVKSVKCDIHNKKVTVVAAAARSPADILMKCREVFKKSRMWSDDD